MIGNRNLFGVWNLVFGDLTFCICDMYQERFYRRWIKKDDLVSQQVSVKETDIFISTDKNIDKKFIKDKIENYRQEIEEYIAKDKNFLTSLSPLKLSKGAPLIVKEMIRASQKADVGPMAAVAGAIAQFLGEELCGVCREIIVENGGDIFIKTNKKRYIGIYAGESPFSRRLTLEIRPRMSPLGICTSSGSVGHSLSFGNLDAAVILADSAILADALATACGNRVKTKEDLEEALDFAKAIHGVKGIILVMGAHLCLWGEMKLVE